jgi:hypothetical protein
LRCAYELIGYHPNSFKACDGRRAATATIVDLVRDLVTRIQGTAASDTLDGAFCRLTFGVGTILSILIARCERMANGFLRWPVLRRIHPRSDLVLLVRMQEGNKSILDYYVIPRDRFPEGAITLRKTPKPELEHYRLATFDAAVAAIQRHQNVAS